MKIFALLAALLLTPAAAYANWPTPPKLTVGAHLTHMASIMPEVVLGHRQAVIVAEGDSITAGSGANGSGMCCNNRANSWPSYLGARLNGYNPTVSDHVIGANRAEATGGYGAYNTESVLQGGWDSTNGFTVGGPYFVSTVDGDLMSWDPAASVDTLKLIYLTDTIYGAAMLDVSWGPSGTGYNYNINFDQAAAVRTSTFNAPLDNNRLIMKKNGGTSLRVLGALAYSSNTRFLVLNGGSSGSTTFDWTASANPQSPSQMLGVYAPDLVIICLGKNESQQSLMNEANFKTALGAMITTAQATGADVMLMVPPLSGAEPTATNDLLINQWIRDVGTTRSLRVMDVPARAGWTSYAIANANGYMRDFVHPTAAGYTNLANMVLDNIQQ